MQKQRKSSQETIVGPSSSSRDLHTSISLSSSAGTKGPTQVEDGKFRLSTRFLEHRPVTSPPTNQKKVTHPTALTPNVAFENSSLKAIEEFRFSEHQPPVLPAWPCSKPLSALNSDILVCLASLCVGHTNLGSTTCGWWEVSTEKHAQCESCELFYLCQNEDYNPGDSLSESSQELLQRRKWGGQYVCDFGEGGYVQSSTHFGRGLLLVTRMLLLVRRSRCLH